MFQPAVPVAKILTGIHNSEYVLPAIQREFVWKTEQIRRLFDSLMRGYPIGAFLFLESRASARRPIRILRLHHELSREAQALCSGEGDSFWAGRNSNSRWAATADRPQYRPLV